MKKRVFKMTSMVATMVILISIMLIAISSISASASAGYVFQENFSNPSNNGYNWGAADITLPGSYNANTANGWYDNNDSGTSYRKASGVLRTSSGGANDTEVYHRFTKGTGGDLTITGFYVRTSTRYGSVYIYNGSTVVAKLRIPSPDAQCQYNSAGTMKDFTGAGFGTSGAGNLDFKIVLKWSGTAYTSAEYYIGADNIASDTMATTSGASVANSAQTSVDRFSVGETKNGTNGEWDNFTVYVAEGVILPSASSVSVSGTANIGETLTGSYTYGGDFTQLNSTIKWQQCDTVDGDYIDIEGATSETFVVTLAESGKFIRYQVTPKDNAGNVGTAVASDATSQIPTPSYTVTVNKGNNGSVSSNPGTTVNYNQTITFTITPDPGYQIDTLTFDGGDVTVNGNNEYTTPGLAGDKDLVVTFKKMPATAPAINVTPTHRASETITVTPLGGGAAIEKQVSTSFISYATITVPAVYTLVSYGMKLIDVLNPTKIIDLPIINKTVDGQFAVQVFGDGFAVGNTYKLQSYINYTEDGIDKTIDGAENEFIWE